MSTTIRVTDIVKEELEARKRGDDTFDDVLKRVLGLFPQTIEGITAELPAEIAIATTNVIEEYILETGQYTHIYGETDEGYRLKLLSNENDRKIIEIELYHPVVDRQSFRVDFLYRDGGGNLKLGARFRSRGDHTLSVKYVNHESSAMKETTLGGEDAAKRVGEHLQHMAEASYKRWGK